MHLLVQDGRTLDDEQRAEDLGQTPADIVLLSFADSDLAAAAAVWEALGDGRPSLRLASLGRLRHPMSVDLYVEQVVARARCVLVRLLGGLDYWTYGAEEVAAHCRRLGIALAIVPGDARDDPRLAALSTVPEAALRQMDAYLRHGGPDNLAQALRLAARLGGLDAPCPAPPVPVPDAGEHALPVPATGEAGLAVIVFYRAHLLAGDIAPVETLAAALADRGFGVRAVYVSSLKDPDVGAFVAARLRDWAPAVVLNATAFSAAQGDAGSPLDAAGVPVLQVLLSGAAREAWAESSRGLSQADLAMQVVLPELDGRLLTTAIAFKQQAAPEPMLEFARTRHCADEAGVALAADRALGWARLAATPRGGRRVAVVLSDYPGAAGEGGQVGHAVGLDSFASLDAILSLLAGQGYDTGGASPGAAALTRMLTEAPPAPLLTVADYRDVFTTLPAALRQDILACWGEPEADAAVQDGQFVLRHVRRGGFVLAVQPERGRAEERRATYHDPVQPPRHAYVAFYLWLRMRLDAHALLHLGTHGTLEWLPGKAVALSEACTPAALCRGLPVVYPFIVNNPGEAAAAKRRLGAVTIGHLTPPLKRAGSHGGAIELERLIDEYAVADGLDRRRATLLRREVLDRAASLGLLAESGVAPDAPEDEALARLDAYLCDVKELQIRDGLHVFGQAPGADSRAALVAALRRACGDVGRRAPAPSSWPGVSRSSALQRRAVDGQDTPGHDDGAERAEGALLPPADAHRHDANPTFARIEAALDRCAPSEAAALCAALDGRWVAPGPAGAPTRGRADVLPTGRNLFTVDPRTIPTRSAVALAERAADDLLRRHLQDHGDWPRSLVLDLWGSASLRTGGEDLALALVLLGVRPTWDDSSARVTGVTVLPLAVLDRPRVDVTLRISGLFRDMFEQQILLFDSAVRLVAERDEAPDWNRLAATARGLDAEAFRRATARIYGSAPGDYGAGVDAALAAGTWRDRAALGAAYLAGSAHAYGSGLDCGADFSARVAAADAFVHPQDHRETDLLDGGEHAAHEGGFAAAADALGQLPALYHLDTSQPEAPHTRTLIEEVALVTRGRAANPAWIAGMMRHGYRGGAEIARAVDGLFAFAATLPQRLDRPFDLLFDATLGNPEVDDFLRAANPQARAAMQARLREALRRDLWRPRRNAVIGLLSGDE
ncbi:cobaltochelatase subunit CobN [Rhodopila globiformis]|uniref:Cobaltochelatase subunit CobN n=1 Tax=Rhodopila globiformis TaxID=1071 RepID=A0A2S6NGI5_RHOGL|nr:cobaltochelatase subunit CobN [Rhodopila globiformis]PPQ33726.1 cobaltochelatase subunit CobN [Rhodopila globiformis]